MKFINFLHLVTLAAAMSVSSAGAFEIVTFSGEAYSTDTSAMDVELGVTGYLTEDFENMELLPGLQIEYVNPDGGPSSTLPNIYVDGSSFFFDNDWDGIAALVNTPSNREWNSIGGAQTISQSVTFIYGPAASSVGVGFGNLQADISDHRILVNGAEVIEKLEDLPGFTSGINIRNLYLRIDSPPGGYIQTVTIDQGPTDKDGQIIDHLTIRPVEDTDGDGLTNVDDNCSLVSNAGQRDTDGDGIGNLCDADLNNDCEVNVLDLGLFRKRFFSTDPNADFNGDGVVNVLDLGILRVQFFLTPGPAGASSICS